MTSSKLYLLIVRTLTIIISNPLLPSLRFQEGVVLYNFIMNVKGNIEIRGLICDPMILNLDINYNHIHLQL